MPKISPLIILVTTTNVLFLIGFWFLIMPQLHALGLVQAEQDALRDQSSNSTVGSRQKASQAALAQTKALAQVLLPAEDMQYDLSVQLEGLTKQLGLPLTSLGISAVDPTAPLPKTATAPAVAGLTANKVTITLSTSGPYKKVQEFVSALPTINRLILIDQLVVTVAGQAVAPGSAPAANTSVSGSDLVSVQITAFAYFLPTPPVAK